MWTVIISFIKNYYPVVLIIAVYVIIIALMRSSYKEGYSTCDQEWQEKEKAAQFDRLRELRTIETRERQRQSEIIREYTDKLRALEDAQKRQIDQILDASSTAIRNAGDPVCAVQSQSDRLHANGNSNNKLDNRGRLSSNTNNRSGTVCYSEKQLRRQIAESVAIAQECDREMKRFKALQDVCRQQ